MTDQIAEVTAPVQEAAAPAAKAPKKGRVAKQTPRVAPKKGKAGTKATPAKKTPKAPKTRKPVKQSRAGTKTEQVLELLKRPEGATLSQIMETTQWQAHSVRGFISGTLGQENGAHRDLRQAGGRRTRLLDQIGLSTYRPSGPLGVHARRAFCFLSQSPYNKSDSKE